MKHLLAALALTLIPSLAAATCTPGGAWASGKFFDGPILCASDLNNNNNYIENNFSGNALLTKQNHWSQPNTFPSVILTPGSTPGTLVNGQVWTTATGMYVRIAGTTVGPLGTGGGGGGGGVSTVAGLPTCNGGAEGTRWAVTDALSPSWLGVVYGGGTVHTGVGCNGTAWVAGY